MKDLKDVNTIRKQEKTLQILRQNSRQSDQDLRDNCVKRPRRGEIRIQQKTSTGEHFYCEAAGALPKDADYPPEVDDLAMVYLTFFESQKELNGGLLDISACVNGVVNHVLKPTKNVNGVANRRKRKSHREEFQEIGLNLSDTRRAAEKLVDFVRLQLDRKDSRYLYEIRSRKGRDFVFVLPILSKLVGKDGQDFVHFNLDEYKADALATNPKVNYLVFVVGFPSKWNTRSDSKRFFFKGKTRIDRSKIEVAESLIIRTMYIVKELDKCKPICQQGLAEYDGFCLKREDSQKTKTRRRSQSKR